MSKEGCFLGLGQEVVRGWGNCLKYLKRGWNRKDRRRNRHFKKRTGDKLGQGLGTLKKRGYTLFMLHVSAALKGRYSKFLGRGENLLSGDLAFYRRT